MNVGQIINYFIEDPLRIFYFFGGSGGIWFWFNEWRFRTRVKVRILDETLDNTENPNVSVISNLEIVNLGDSVTSIEPVVIMKALTPERDNVTYQFSVEGHERSFMPHSPKTITLKTVCEAKYPFTWYRSYEIVLTRGSTFNLRILNASMKELSFIQFWIGRTLFKLFNWLPSKT